MTGCHRGDAPPLSQAESPSIQVRLAAVTDTQVVQAVVASGVLGAKEEIPLGFKIGGVIASITVEEGERIRAGQVLATLEQPEIAGAVAKAEAGLGQAERDLRRAEALFADSVIPRSAWEGARTAAEVARADVQVARFNQRYAAIRAPVAGTVLRRSAEPGQQISGGTPVLVLASAERGQVVRVGLADVDVARVAPGDRASIRFQGGTGQPVAGRVSQIAAQANPGAGTWTVEIRLDHPLVTVTGAAASGLIGAVEITPARAESVQLIPIQALLEGDSDSATVYTVSGKSAEPVASRRRVHIAFLAGDQVAVRGGLEGVNQVVTDGAPYLQEGAPVRPIGSQQVPEEGGR
jgi:RND family efflux transporter MFP subunit